MDNDFVFSPGTLNFYGWERTGPVEFKKKN